jgi:hypothetical protein
MLRLCSLEWWKTGAVQEIVHCQVVNSYRHVGGCGGYTSKCLHSIPVSTVYSSALIRSLVTAVCYTDVI